MMLDETGPVHDTAEKKVGAVSILWDQLKLEMEDCRCQGKLVSTLLERKLSVEESLEATMLKALCLELGDEKWIPFEALHLHLCDSYLPFGMDVEALESDIRAARDRDPACRGFLEVLLLYKGFFALQCYRVAHWHWKNGETMFARMLQKRVADLVSIDIHPAAVIESGIFVDHGTGIVIGETAVVSRDVSILHGVTLGGTGKHSGDRHPKVGQGVLIGANSTILGNITIGAHCKIGAGSVVLESVPMRCTVAGVPARVVRMGTPLLPSHDMSQKAVDFNRD